MGFQVLAIVNNIAKNIHVQDLCGHRFSFILGTHPRVQLLGHIVTLCMFNIFEN